MTDQDRAEIRTIVRDELRALLKMQSRGGTELPMGRTRRDVRRAGGIVEQVINATGDEIIETRVD